ncbi:MAG: glycerophosphoryl diester phosphodiesterase [Proteobacteria bacterium]|nr:glycerophosphoryl diester phosphodiesterase [Pseudomonadota bacterium]
MNPLLKGTLAVLLLSTSLFASVAADAEPLRIAHRGGTGDAPENTVTAIRAALANRVDAVWITVQLSRDGVPVLYRPATLDVLTNASGPVSAQTAAQLAQVDAGWNTGKSAGSAATPWRGRGIGIPTLEAVLRDFPETVFFVDIKSPDAPPHAMAQALAGVLQATGSLTRTRVYSTDQRYLGALPAQVNRFESRDLTRGVLAQSAMAHRCELPAADDGGGERWFGLEMKRDVEVVEKYTLGEARSRALLVWDQEAIDCFRSQGRARIVLFDVNSEADYRQAKALGADAVMINSPAQFRAIAR